MMKLSIAAATTFPRRLSRRLAAGWLAAAALLLAVPTLSHAQDPVAGSLDTTPFPGFAAGNGKISNLAIGSSDDVAVAVAVQADGRILLAGGCNNGVNSDFCIARLNPDGTLDTSFDGPSGNANGKFLLPMGSGGEAVSAMLVQPDGKIVLAGSCTNGADFDFCVARLNPDGSLDTSLIGPGGLGAGKVMIAVGTGNDIPTAVLLQTDGKIVIAGHCIGAGGFEDFCAARLLPDGALDPAFDGPGGSGNGKFLFPVGTSTDFVYSAALQVDGKIVLAGACWGGANNDFCVARLNTDGSLDTGFDGPLGGGNGKFLIPVGAVDDAANAVVVQPDGKIVLAGTCDTDFCIARLNADGTFDSNFDGPSGASNGRFLLPIGASDDGAFAMALQGDGKIVLAGTCLSAGVEDFCVARLHADGSLDASFDGPPGNGNGKFLLPIGGGADFARAVALQADGKIVVAGFCSNGSNADFCVARLNGGSSAARACSLDIDGDGLLTPTIDSLIHARVALGLRGPAVIGGITFSPSARRNTWPLIRDYLASQCGLSIF